MDKDNTKRDLVLAPHTHCYVQDISKGTIKTFVGPTVINQTAQEVPVVYNHKKGFLRVEHLGHSVRDNAIAVEGSYLELFNPIQKFDMLSPIKGQPSEGSAHSTPELDVGRRVNLPGPVSFALWPGQYARSIRGHHLHHNQYLLVRVYNADEAEKNWKETIAKGSGGTVPDKGTSGNILVAPRSFAVGTKLIIRGDEVSFYIPPTGIVVEAEGCDKDGKCIYVRDALTLERLEYCILVKENGTKRFERGPQVVFPQPDERFIEKDDKGIVSRKFAAVELNEIQGIHIKVIAPYKEGSREYREGEELFITGKDTPIYFPREEHSVVRYDGKTKHFATAIPKGEGRYVMDRKNGNIDTAKGPAMLLPNPTDKVIIRRALTDLQCQLWYPGNGEVFAYNQALRGIAERAPSTRTGAVSEGDALRGLMDSKGGGIKGRHAMLGSQTLSMATTSYGAVMEASRVSGDQDLMGDEFERGSSYTQPRTVTLNTRFQGVPSVEIWTGFAIQVKDRSGNRRIVQGPATVLLEYDEDMEVLELSTGKPKTTDNMFRTVFLRTTDNKVADVFEVETKDHVMVQVKLSYRLNFEGDPNRWFSVANYVKLLCDHGRSLLKGAIRRLSIDQFYADPTQHIRDGLLGVKVEGGKRTGISFPENGAVVIDVDVLTVMVADASVKNLLDKAQSTTIQSAINLSNKERDLQVVRRMGEIDLSIAQAQHEVATKHNLLEREKSMMDMELFLLKAVNDLKRIGERHKLIVEEQRIVDQQAGAARTRLEADRMLELNLAEKEMDQLLIRLKGESEAVVQRFSAAQGGFSEALLALSNNETAIKVAQAWGIQEILGGKNFADTLKKVFEGTPLGSWVEKHVMGPTNGASSSGRGMASSQLPQS